MQVKIDRRKSIDIGLEETRDESAMPGIIAPLVHRNPWQNVGKDDALVELVLFFKPWKGQNLKRHMLNVRADPFACLQIPHRVPIDIRRRDE